jgi:hypothetical protein
MTDAIVAVRPWQEVHDDQVMAANLLSLLLKLPKQRRLRL